MAQRVITQFISDLSGKELGEGDGRTVPFSFDGKSYTIDLTNKEADDFAKAVATYVDSATRVSGARRSGGSTSSRSSNGDAGAIREWAKSQGMDVSERGRISSEVRDAYSAVH